MHLTRWRSAGIVLAIGLVVAQAPGSAQAASAGHGDALIAQYGPVTAPGVGMGYPGFGGAPGMMGAPLGAPSGQAGAGGPSTEECARYSGQSALPYFGYALNLAGSDSP